MSQLQRPVNMSIEQDWGDVLLKYSNIHNMIIEGKLDKNRQDYYNYNANWPVDQYNFNNLGSVIVDKHLSKDWGTWTGKLFHSHLPWYKQAIDFFADLNFNGVGLSVTYNDVKLHHDKIKKNEETMSQCKILYIIQSDDTRATTLSQDSYENPKVIKSFLSAPKKSFLLDTNYPHAVKSNGYRSVLQFKFFNDFDTVSNFLDRCGPIRFS